MAVPGRSGIGAGTEGAVATRGWTASMRRGAGGAWVGWIGLPGVLLWASAAGLSFVAARLLVGGKVSGEDRLPFGPCLAAGVWLTWMLGPLGL
ncbi:hypothetical protein GCM10007859_16940 [Brevundimonas denitrificans]|uniref:Prepilin peptidase n=2 Tax=Brevundimonas denitrificans TaxID=1443434 RepID=A0ABQ6BJ09_9CAUL|nr:hypothetical protein GCM10007859_16940 [Brevundimonas denitrificans]